MSLFRKRNTPRVPSESQFYVRDAAEADVRDVVEMKLASWRETYAEVRDEEFFAAAEATLDDQVAFWQKQRRRGTGIWLAEDLDDQVVGVASAGGLQQRTLEKEAEHGELPNIQLHTLYVLNRAQGTGVADTLLARALGEEADESQPVDAVLWVVEHNRRAIAFYRRHGFREVGEPVEMTGPWAGLREQLMVRRGR